MEYTVDDKELDAAAFIQFANRIWPGIYDENKTRAALSKTINIAAYDKKKLAGCLRILSDGVFSGRSQSFSFFRNIEDRESAAHSSGLPGKTLQQCCILARSRAWSIFMKRTDVKKGCNPMEPLI